MNDRLSASIDWCTNRNPTRVCRACKTPYVIEDDKPLPKTCPSCGASKERDGMHWHTSGIWVPKNLMTIEDERQECKSV